MKLVPLLFAASVLTACGGSSQGPVSDDDSPPDASPPDAPSVVASPDLGKFCPMGCNLTTCVDTSSDECESGNCVWDGRGSGDAYCSQSCATSGCPTGYSCIDAADDTGTFCFADPAVCGDSIVQRGEKCDAGATNGMPASGCAADCKRMIVGGRTSFTLDGALVHMEGTSTTGDRVTAELSGGSVYIGWNGADTTFGVTAAVGALTAFPQTALGRVSLFDEENNWCYANPIHGEGMVVTVTQWNGSTHITGSFDGTLSAVPCSAFAQLSPIATRTITASSFDIYL